MIRLLGFLIVFGILFTIGTLIGLPTLTIFKAIGVLVGGWILLTVLLYGLFNVN